MAYPLLPVGATGAVYVRKHYPALLKDIIRDCTDSINALNLFNELVSAPDGIAPDSPGFKEFDAHGGDMACHIRAGMLHELYDKHRAYFLETGHEFLGDPVVHYYLTQFETVRSRAQHACIQLTKHNTDPEKLGFERKRDTLLHVVQVLGWENEKGGGGPFDFLPSAGNSSPTTTSPGGESMPSSTGTRSSISSSAGTGTSTPLHSSMSTLSLASSITPMSSPSSPSHSACKRDATSPTWDVHDSYTAVLFLAAASVLAKFKEFARMGSRITVRFVPQKAMDHGNELIEPYWDRSNTNYVDFKINRIKDRHCFLQKWLSLISCSWVQSWAAGLQLSDDLQRFMLESTHKSPREVSVSAAFPTYLVCREIWANRQWPLLLLVRHFCEDGYHLRAYTTMATRPEASPDDSCSREGEESSTSGLHRPAGWPLRRVAIQDLVTDPQYRTQPYITIFGNSMQGGSHLDYLGRAFREDGHHRADVPYHADEDGQPVCARQAAHDRAFQARDHDLLAKCLLADHTQFPFEAPPRPDQRAGTVEGVARVSRAIEALRDRYAAQVNALGGGPVNIDVYCWEHVFAETPARVAAEVQAKVAAGDLNLFF